MSCNVISIILTFCVFASFGWGIKNFFRVQDEEAIKTKKKLGVFGLIAILLIVAGFGFTKPISCGVTSLAWVSLCAAFFIFWWAIRTNIKSPLLFAFSSSGSSSLVTTGPYRFIRHPFYSSYMLGWFGSALATGHYWLLVNVIFFGSIYIRAALNEEGRYLAGENSEAYKAYRMKTGMFLPNPLKILKK